MEAQANRISGAPIGFELRLDYLEDFAQFDSQFRQMLVRLHSPQTIATCRRTAVGGLFQGTVRQQATVLASAARAGCRWIDVELESVQEARTSLLREFRPANVIVS